MTLWARLYEFQITFGDDWTVTMNESPDEVEYVIQPNENISIDITSYEFEKYKTQLTSIGAKEAEIFYNDTGFGFRTVVPREKLPEDYDKTLS